MFSTVEGYHTVHSRVFSAVGGCTVRGVQCCGRVS